MHRLKVFLNNQNKKITERVKYLNIDSVLNRDPITGFRMASHLLLQEYFIIEPVNRKNTSIKNYKRKVSMKMAIQTPKTNQTNG